MKRVILLFAGLACAGLAYPQHVHSAAEPSSLPLQPFAQQVRRLEDALNFLGQPLPPNTQRRINEAIDLNDEARAVLSLQQALEPYVLAIVDINGESRVKVERRPAKSELVQGGSRFFLVKVLNRAQITSPLIAASPNSGRVFIPSKNDPAPKMILTPQDVRDRWAEVSIYNKPPMEKRLSGLQIEYQILEVYSRDQGQRSADIAFNVGQGTQDIGFRNDILVLFTAVSARKIPLHILDEHGELNHRVPHNPRPLEPFISQSFETSGARFLLSAANLPRRWRIH